MNFNSLIFLDHNGYIRAASDSQLSSSETQLLKTLLSEEDQYEYYQIINIQLHTDIRKILNQVSLFFSIFFNCLFKTYFNL